MLAIVPLTAGTALTAWRAAPLVDAGLIAGAGGYLLAGRQVRRRHPRRPWPRTRTLTFLLGLAVVGAVTQGSADVYDGVLLSAHMVQHVLLLMVAPPLLILGRPLTLLLHAVRGRAHGWIITVLRSRAARALTWPPGATALYVVVVAGSHTPPVMDLVVRNEAVHAAEHALYLAAGYLYFLPIVGSEPVGRRISALGRYLMLLAGMQADTAVGVALLLQDHEIFAVYARAGRTWGPAPVADLHLSGMIMWMGSDAIMTVVALAVSVALVRDPRRCRGPAAAAWTAPRAAGLTAAGSPAAVRPPDGRTPGTGPRRARLGEDADLAAYNALLQALADGLPPGGTARRPPPGE